MKKALFLLIIAAVLTGACGQHRQPAETEHEHSVGALTVDKNHPGDSSLYGLACDGCTDSVLVFLDYQSGPLDTFDIIEANHEHRIYGRPHIGDEMAVILNPEDHEEALMVINMENLRSMWCYMVTPTLRQLDQMPKRMRRRMMERVPDSIKRLMMAPREYSLRLKRDNTVMARGGQFRQTTTDDMSPVEYPPIKRYTDWHLYNGRIVLKADTISGFSKEGDKPSIDTADIEMLTMDTLILRFNDHTQHYYRKTETETEN